MLINMERKQDALSTVGWYEEISQIRERLSLEMKHLKKIRDLTSKTYNVPLSEVRDADFMEMYQTLLLSYPVLAKRHLEDWESFRELCSQLYESDNERGKLYLHACLMAVKSDFVLDSIKEVDDPEMKEFYQAFDYMDKVSTLKENKGKMPFKMIEYDDARLEKVIKTIDETNIRKVIGKWLKGYPREVYPEVKELYMNHYNDGTWFP